MNFQDYIKADLLILIPVLYLIGVGLKKSNFPDKWIPITLGMSSVVLSSIWVLTTTEINGLQEIASAIFTAVTQGILVAGASVYVNQIYIQARKEE